MDPSYARPKLVIEWAPDIYPGVDNGSWTPVRDTFNQGFNGADWEPFPVATAADGRQRIVSYSHDRGRRKVTDEMGAGSATLVLENPTGNLDPSVPGNDAAGHEAGTPVRVWCEWGGFMFRVFGGVTNGPWQPTMGRGKQKTVTLRVDDWIGYAAALDEPYNRALVDAGSYSGKAYTFWMRGPADVSMTAYDGGGHVWDFGESVTSWNPNAGVIAPGDVLTGCNERSILLAGGTTLAPVTPGSIYESDTTPGFGSVLHLCFVLAGKEYGAHPSDHRIIYGLSTSGSVVMWEIGITTSGGIYCRVNDAAGGELARASASGANFVDGDARAIGVVIDTAARGVSLTWEGGTNSASWSTTSAGVNGRIFMNAFTNCDISIAEFRAGSAVNILTPHLSSDANITLTSAGPSSCLKYDAPVTGSRSAALGTVGGQISEFTPMASHIQACANALGGVAFCDRSGRVKLRAGSDLGTYSSTGNLANLLADNMVDVSAVISDVYGDTGARTINGRSYSLPVIRGSWPGYDGYDPGRIANWATIGKTASIDKASWRRYGKRAMEMDGVGQNVASTWPGYQQAKDYVAARKQPSVSIPDVTIRPFGSTAMTAWVLGTLDLEARALVKMSDPATKNPVLNDVRARVQHESWSWTGDGSDWTVQISLDQPVPNK